MSTEIAVALITTLGGIVAGLIGLYKVRQTTHSYQAETNSKLQQKALDFGAFMEEWSGTHDEILHLLENTCIDRFLIFRAWNGRLAPRWTTAVFQLRLGKQDPISYVHFELDVDYVSRLKEISIRNVVAFDVEDLQDCAIKRIYEAEGVKSAVWVHITSEAVEGTDTVAHTYCSFATHSDEGIEQNLVTKCQILGGRLKGIALTFGNGE